MNLRRDNIDKVLLPEPKFKVNDQVRANGDVTGKIIHIGDHKGKLFYVIQTDKTYNLGIASVDHDIKLLKPIGVQVKCMTLWEDEVRLETIETVKKYPHIVLGSSFVQTVPVNYGTSSTGPH